MEERKGNTTKNEIALRVFKILHYIVTIVGCTLIFCIIVAVCTGIAQSNKDVAWVTEVNHKLFAGETEEYPEDNECILEARIVNGNEKGEWYHDAIIANFGDQIEVRLKAFSAHPENVRRDIAYHKGLSVSCTAGLGVTKFLLDKKVALPNAELTDYPENANSDNVQYYYIGTFRFNWKDWVNGKPAAMLTARNYNGPGASLLVLSPYGAVEIRTIAIMVGLAISCFLILPIIFDIFGYLIIKHMNGMQ